MVYDEALTARVRRELLGTPEVEEKKVFGGVTFSAARRFE